MSLSSRINDLAAVIRDKINLMTPRLIPSGGSVGQYVQKTGASPDTFGWATPAGSGGGGTSILDLNGLGAVPSEFVLDFNGVS